MRSELEVGVRLRLVEWGEIEYIVVFITPGSSGLRSCPDGSTVQS